MGAPFIVCLFSLVSPVFGHSDTASVQCLTQGKKVIPLYAQCGKLWTTQVKLPDLLVINRGFEEMLDMTRRIAAAEKVPVMADGEDGFGGPDRVFDVVAAYAEAGVAGIRLPTIAVLSAFATIRHTLSIIRETEEFYLLTQEGRLAGMDVASQVLAR